MKNFNLKTVLAILFIAFTVFSCKNEDGPEPLFEKVIGKWDLVSGVQKDSKDKSEDELVGGDTFRMSYIFIDSGEGGGYAIMNNEFVSFSYTTKDNSVSINVTGTKEVIEHKVNNYKYNELELEYKTSDTYFNGKFKKNSKEINREVTGKWSLRQTVVWITDENGQKIPIKEELDEDVIFFEFLENGQGTMSGLDLDDFGNAPVEVDVEWKSLYDVLLVSETPEFSEGMVMYIKSISAKELVLESIVDEQSYELTFSKI